MTKFTYTRQSYPNYIGIGTQNGGYICEWDPFSLKIKIGRSRGIYKIAVWDTSNLVIFVERQGDCRFFVWDLETSKVWDVVKTDHGIEDIRTIGDELIVATVSSILIYKLPSFNQTRKITKGTFPYAYKDNNIFCKSVDCDTHMLGPTLSNKIVPHQNEIGFISMNEDGNVATVSTKGTIIRVWRNGKQIWEGRRGLEPTRIVSMDYQGSALVLASKKGSVHFFNTCDEKKQGYMWNDLPKSRYVWYVGETPFVQLYREQIYMADETGLITIGSQESGEILFQTSLLGDETSPFTIPLT